MWSSKTLIRSAVCCHSVFSPSLLAEVHHRPLTSHHFTVFRNFLNDASPQKLPPNSGKTHGGLQAADCIRVVLQLGKIKTSLSRVLGFIFSPSSGKSHFTLDSCSDWASTLSLSRPWQRNRVATPGIYLTESSSMKGTRLSGRKFTLCAMRGMLKPERTPGKLVHKWVCVWLFSISTSTDTPWKDSTIWYARNLAGLVISRLVKVTRHKIFSYSSSETHSYSLLHLKRWRYKTE